MRPRQFALVLVLAAAAVVALGLSLFGRVNPAPVGDAAGTASPAPTVAASPGGASAAPAGDGALDGTWRVDPTRGSVADWSASFVGYRVKEELASVGAIEAVGRTPQVSGTLELAGTTVTAASFTADLSTLQSDEPRRDGQMGRQGLQTDTYPTGTFTLTRPIELGSIPADGASVTVDAAGDLTLHGETRSVTIPLTAVLAGDEIAVTGSFVIRWEDFGMAKPSSFIVVSLADELTVELRLRFAKG